MVSEDPNRAPMPAAEPDPYLVAWADLRQRRRAMLLSLGAYLLGGLAALAIGRGPATRLVLLVLCGVCLVVTAWARRFRCPLCGERFSRGRRDGLLNRWCAHCRIGIGTPSPPHPAPPP